MPAGLGDGLDDEVADLAGQFVQLGVAQRPQIGGLPDLVQGHVGNERYPSSCRPWYSGRPGELGRATDVVA